MWYRKRRKYKRRRLPRAAELTIARILAWADFHRERTGNWPIADSRGVLGAIGEKWANIDAALRQGSRGLPGRSSLAQLLAERRGVRNRMRLPPLADKQILAWADAYHRRSGRWPKKDSGCIDGAPGETWKAVNAALKRGARRLPGGSSLARLLSKYRGVRNYTHPPPLALDRVLAWADAHRKREGSWPHLDSGPVREAPQETWLAIDKALRYGRRGLEGGSSLPNFLFKKRGARNPAQLPRLTRAKILAWADAHFRRAGAWPTQYSGPIDAAPGETWCAVNQALTKGARGFSGGSSLARLLVDQRGKRSWAFLPRLTIKKILTWARAHRHRTGSWPTRKSGPIEEAPGETWSIVNSALQRGHRGLPGKSLLSQVLHDGSPSTPAAARR